MNTDTVELTEYVDPISYEPTEGGGCQAGPAILVLVIIVVAVFIYAIKSDN